MTDDSTPAGAPASPRDWTTADRAVAYARHGWPVIWLHVAVGGVCSCGHPGCPSPGKHPRSPHGLSDATTDTTLVARRWAEHPNSNIGIVPGRAGMLVLDLDGTEGEAAAQRLGLLGEPTLEVTTGRGRHRYYRHPGGTIGNAPLAPHLDVRADAGYVLVPPSVHPSGHVYRWHGKTTDIADLPPAVVALLRGRPAPARSAAHQEGLRLTPGTRNDTLARIAGSLRRQGCSSDQIVRMLEPLNADAVEPLDADELEAVARSIGRYPPATQERFRVHDYLVGKTPA